MKSSEFSIIILGQFLWIGIWFFFGVNFLGWLGIITLLVTLVNVAFFNDSDSS